MVDRNINQNYGHIDIQKALTSIESKDLINILNATSFCVLMSFEVS